MPNVGECLKVNMFIKYTKVKKKSHENIGKKTTELKLLKLKFWNKFDKAFISI